MYHTASDVAKDMRLAKASGRLHLTPEILQHVWPQVTTFCSMYRAAVVTAAQHMVSKMVDQQMPFGKVGQELTLPPTIDHEAVQLVLEHAHCHYIAWLHTQGRVKLARYIMEQCHLTRPTGRLMAKRLLKSADEADIGTLSKLPNEIVVVIASKLPKARRLHLSDIVQFQKPYH